jgi:hypothetical protein
MPKATAVWLVDNTSLTFDQIADFCELHPLEVQGIADGEVAKGILGIDPISSGQLSKDEIELCEKDHNRKLHLTANMLRLIKEQHKQKKSGKYTPIARRQDKPDAIAWIIKNLPEMSDNQIVKLIGTTKSMIASVRDKSHWNMPNIKPKDPVLLGLCTQSELDYLQKLALAKHQEQQAKHTKDINEQISKMLES